MHVKALHIPANSEAQVLEDEYQKIVNFVFSDIKTDNVIINKYSHIVCDYDFVIKHLSTNLIATMLFKINANQYDIPYIIKGDVLLFSSVNPETLYVDGGSYSITSQLFQQVVNLYDNFYIHHKLNYENRSR